MASRSWRELALDVIDKLEVQVEQFAQEPDDEQQVLLSVRERCGGGFGVVEPC